MNCRTLLPLIQFLFITFWGCDLKFQDSRSDILTEAPVRITKDSSPKHEPAWSPDGSKIAYSVIIYATQFISHSLEGEHQITLGQVSFEVASEFAISPDRTQIVFTANGSNKLLILNLASQLPVRELAPGFANVSNPAWSPDGSQIVFSAALDGDDAKIRTISAAGGTALQITSEIGNHRNPSWSPAGDKIAFDVEIDTTSVVKVVTIGDGTTVTLTPDSIISRDPAWASTGGLIAFTALRNDTTGIWVVADTGGIAKKISRTTALAHRPAWSSDGTKIAFKTSDRILVAKPSGEILTVTELREHFPVWIPGENALIRTQPVRQSVIEVFSLDDSTVSQLTTASGAQEDISPAWYPDSQTILFVRRVKKSMVKQQTIWTVRYPLQQGQAQPLFGAANRFGFENNPAISPDGTLMVYDDGTGMFLIALADKHIVDLTPFIGSNLRQAAWSPAGNSIVCSTGRGLQIFATDSSFAMIEQTIPYNLNNPAWSNPHPVFGENIAGESASGIYIFSLARNSMQWAVAGGRNPSWSPDGSRLAFMWRDQIYILKILLNLPGE